MKIGTLEDFTPQAWEKVFGAFVIANRSHWRGAPYDAVLNILKTKGRFEFTVTGMSTWTSKFVIVVVPDGLDVEFIPNDALSQVMRDHLATMKQTFEREIRRLY